MNMLLRLLLALCAMLVASSAWGQQSSVPGSSSASFATTEARCLGFELFMVPVPAYGIDEPFLLYRPTRPVDPKAVPLLVVNHRFGVSALDVENTLFPEVACLRDWYVVSVQATNPFGLIPGANVSQNNYGSADSQECARAGIEFVIDNFPIDKKRIYGVGFSMGSAQCLSYAARHQDPDRGMFAALVNHTGSIDQADTYLSDPNSRESLENTMTGSPSSFPFAYRRSSMIEIDPVSGQLINNDVAFVHNLLQTPTQVWMATQDPWAYLTNQTNLVADFLTQQPSAQFDLQVVPSSTHEWFTINFSNCVSFLEQHSLVIPSERRIVADRDGRWIYFDISGIPADTFARLDYQIDLDNDLFSISEGQSFNRIETDLARWNDGLTHTLPLTANLDFAQGGVELVLTSVEGVPMAVSRDGTPMTAGWSYDPATQTLAITDPDPGAHTWEFLP